MPKNYTFLMFMVLIIQKCNFSSSFGIVQKLRHHDVTDAI